MAGSTQDAGAASRKHDDPSAVSTGDASPPRRSLGDAMVRGAVAGALGALAMVLTHKASSKVLLGSAAAAYPSPANRPPKRWPSTPAAS